MPISLRRALLVVSALASLAVGATSALGAPGIDFSPDTSGGIAFGGVEVGGLPQSQFITVTNTGDDPLDVTSADLVPGGDAAHFGVGDGCSFGAPLDPDESCQLQISFAPTTPGAKTSTLEVASDAPGSPHLIDLTGTGTQAAVQMSTGALDFGTRSVDDDPSATQRVTIVNGGTAPLEVLGVQISGTDAISFPVTAQNCDGADIAPGANCTVDITFDPKVRGALTASLDVISNAPGSPHSVSLTGTGVGPELSPSPATLGFGDHLVADPASPPEVLTITNGGDGPLTVSDTEIIGPGFQSFAVASNTCSGVAPAATCAIGVTFDPVNAGAKSATLSITSNAGPAPTDIPLTGTGLSPAFDVDPATVDFGSREVDAIGASAPETVTVTNDGSASLAIDTLLLEGADPADFVLSSDTCTDADLAPSVTCTVDVAFDPATPGAKSATLTFPTDAPGSPHAVVLSGTGTQPALNARATLPLGSQPTDLGPTPSQRISVENTGTATLDVGTVVLGGTDPGAFAVSANTCDGASLAPSANCAVDVTFDPDAQVAYAATITIPSNAPGSPHVVALSGSGAPPTAAPVVTLDPGLALILGDQPIADGPTAPTVLTVGNTGTANLNIGATTIGGSDPGEFSLVANGCADTIVGPGDECTVGVRFDPTATGAKTATLTLASNDGPIVVSLDGTGTEPLFARAPAGTIGFGELAVLAPLPVIRTITITSDGTADLAVLSAVVQDDPGFAFGVDSQTCVTNSPFAPTDTCTIDIAFDPGTPGLHQANLVVTTNAPDSPHSIPLEGTGTQPIASFDAPSLDFGDQRVADGPSADQRVTVTNTGTAPLNVAAVTVGGTDSGEFAVSDETCAGSVIAPGTDCVVDVAFDPSSTGAKDAQLVLASDTTTSPDQVALSGVAVAVPSNTEPPAVTGPAHRDGTALGASTGTWDGTATISYTYRWQRCDATGADCVDIGGAVAAAYTPAAADVGATLRVVVEATNGLGSASSTSATTSVVSPRNTAVPAVSGTPIAGGELATDDGDWNGAGGLDLTRRWERCPAAGGLAGCAAIADAAGTTYRPGAADVGMRLRAVVAARKNGSDEVEAASAPTATVTAAEGGTGAPGGEPGAPGATPQPGAPAPGTPGPGTPGPGAATPTTPVVPGAPGAPGARTGARLLRAKVTVVTRKKARIARSAKARTAYRKAPRAARLQVRLSEGARFTARVTRQVRPDARAKKRSAAALRRCKSKRTTAAKRSCRTKARKLARTRWVKVGRVRTATASPSTRIGIGRLRPGRYRVDITVSGTKVRKSFQVRPDRVKLVLKKRGSTPGTPKTTTRRS